MRKSTLRLTRNFTVHRSHLRPRVAKQAPIDCRPARFRWTSAAIRRELGAVRTRTSGPARSSAADWLSVDFL
jgi:hypothetical protein